MNTETPPEPLALRSRKVTRALLGATFIAMAGNALFYFGVVINAHSGARKTLLTVFLCVAALQAFLGVATLLSGIVYAVQLRRRGESMWTAIGMAFLGLFGSAGGALGGVTGVAVFGLGAGGGWGRPLRVRGRIRHPELKHGSDWTRGDAPSVGGLDTDTRAALEALWLHDAQKEHASVPAFARVAWMLTAIGAPAELVERTFRAAQEEIEHTRLCFALAAGYGGHSHSVEPMPELLVGGLDVKGDALVHLALESLNDGCLLEDYNADVAAACRDACKDPVTGTVLRAIAREERDHAELSWSIVEYCLERSEGAVRDALVEALAGLRGIERPTAVSEANGELVSRANVAALRAHGRLPDSEWAAIFSTRLEQTEQRLRRILGIEEGMAIAV